MALFFLLLCFVILGYAYLTDSDRVRHMAENYLSTLIGGRVTIGDATLSVFEGLRVDDVKVYVDGNPDAAADSELFSARTFILRYEPRSMLRGQLRATQIIIEKPRVHLTQDVAAGTWNFDRLARNLRRTPQPLPHPVHGAGAPLPLPEVMLRGARVEIGALQHGRRTSLGYMAIDGQLTPDSDNDHYGFILQTRSVSDAMSALVSGSVQLSNGHVLAGMKDFILNHDVQSMLPEGIRAVLARFALAGKVDIPLMDYQPAHEGKLARFTVRMLLNDVSLAVPPEEWMSGREVRRRDDASAVFAGMQAAYLLAGAAPLASPVSPRTPVDAVVSALASTPIQLQKVSGSFVFDQNGIEVKGLRGTLDQNQFNVTGRFDGYNPDATMELRVESPHGTELDVPAVPPYLWSLPREVREFFQDIHPQGTCKLQLDLVRDHLAGPIQVGGQIDIVNGHFLYKEFAYPLAGVNGRISFGRDPSNGHDWVRLSELRGHGVAGSANEGANVLVNGWVGPIGPGRQEPGVHIDIQGTNFASEPALLAAFDPDVRRALTILDAPGKGQYPQFRGNFLTQLRRERGPGKRISFDTEVDLRDASAIMTDFPYPLHGISGKLKVCDGYLDLNALSMKRGDATLLVNGRVAWMSDRERASWEAATHQKAPKTNVKITARNVPIDAALLEALPAAHRQWVSRMGLAGKVNVDGQLTSAAQPPDSLGKGAWVTSVPPSTQPASPPLDYAFDISMHDGTLQPRQQAFVVSAVTGKLHLTPDNLDLLHFTGQRGKATLSASGQVVWRAGHPSLALRASAHNLLLEPELRALLPPEAASAWDQVQPKGTLDADLTYCGAVGDAPAPPPTMNQLLTVDLNESGQGNVNIRSMPTSGPTLPALPPGMNVVLRPRDLSVRIQSIPYRLDQIAGVINIRPDRITLQNVTARHGDAKLSFSGSGMIGPRSLWGLAIKAENLALDSDLMQAMPAAFGNLCKSMKLAGRLDVSIPKLVFQPGNAAPQPGADASAATSAISASDMDLSATIKVADASMDVGSAMDHIHGGISIDAAIRAGKLAALRGDLDLKTLTLAGRQVQGFRGTLSKPAGKNELTLDRIQGQVCGADLGGQLRLSYPDDGPSRYTLSLAVRNADVRELTGDADQNLSGRLTASLALEGDWDKPNARRGRGDVFVTGKQMYRLPLIIGLVQVTNLGLPISSPFTSATARYSVDGQRVTFQKVELRSNNMLMTGEGNLDFGTKQVRMTFVTDNPGGFQIPLLQQFWQGAQHELLRIHINGTVQEPKVEPSVMGTITTTVDEVFKSDPAKSHARGK